VLQQGTYTINGVNVTSGRHIAGADNLVTIKIPFNGRGFILDGTSNASISNLTFVGSNSFPRAGYSYAAEFEMPIELRNGATHNLIAGNRFQGCQGDVCVMLYDRTGRTNYNTISGNTFTACGLYAVAIDGGNYNVVQGNWANDCAIGSELDADSTCNLGSAGNQFINNHLQSINGIGWNPPGADHKPFLTGGQAACAGAYHNIVRGNVLEPGVKTFACSGCTG
jgi:hypothetical protein